MSDVKLCKDCRWCFNKVEAGFHFCDHPQAEHGLVLGEPKNPCAFERSSKNFSARDGICGPEGKLWQPKPRPWWQFWRRG